MYKTFTLNKAGIIRMHKLSDLIKLKDPTIYCLQEALCRLKNIDSVNRKGEKQNIMKTVITSYGMAIIV